MITENDSTEDRPSFKVALYARVSLDESSKSRRFQNPENQLVPLRDWCKSQGWTVFKEYEDRASGADPNRIQFKEMLSDAMQRRFKRILVWKLDRFSREPSFVIIGRIQRLRERGIGVCSLTESWLDSSKENPMSDFILSAMSWAAGEERRKISERTKAGIARRKAIGQWKGGRPKKRVPPSTTVENDEVNKGPFFGRNVNE